MRRVTSPVLVGRDDELGDLLATLQHAEGDRGGLVVVEGEAGIGKSRLVDEFVANAKGAGAVVMAGSCLPFADAVPYAPLAPIIAHLSAVGGTGESRPAPSDAADRFRFFQWVADQLIAVAAAQPVVVVVEDLHWSDESTGDLLLFVANAVRVAPVVVVATRRPGEGDRSNGLAVALGELVRSGRAHQITLAPLADEQVEALIGEILGIEPSPGLVERVALRADGNPFFTEELVAAGGGDDLPTTVGDVILQRVARVDEATQQLLRVAAVIGRRVSYELLREVAATDSPSTDAAIRDAVRHQLLVALGDGYAFRHALGHETIYGDLLLGERAALHERVAEILAVHPELAVGDGPLMADGELAHHWHAAGRLPESLAVSVRAGKAAEAANAPIEAQIHFRRAIDLWPRVDDPVAVAGTDRLWLLEHAAEAASLAGSNHGAVQLADQLLAELDLEREPERHARIVNRRALYQWHAGDLTESEWATVPLPRDESGVTLAGVARLCGVAHQAALELRYLEGLVLARDAVVAAHRVGDPAELSYALFVLGSLEGHLGSYDDGIARLHRSLELAVEVGDTQSTGATWHNLVEAYVFAGRAGEAVKLAERGLADLERLGLSRTYVVFTTGQLTYALLMLGRWDEADTRSAAVLAGDVHPYFALPVRFARVQLLCGQGRFTEAEAILADLTETFGGYDFMAALGAALQAEIAIWRGDWSAGRAALGVADEIASSSDEILLTLRLASLAIRLEADEFAWASLSAVERDRTSAKAAADARLDRVESLVTRVETAVGCCSLPFQRLLAQARAERARLDEPPSPERWANVAATAGDDLYLRSYAGWREAEALLSGGARQGRARAEAILREVSVAASSLAAAPLVDQIADLARRARIELAGTSPDGDAEQGADHDSSGLASVGLTRRELEVLRLLGDGLSNREIGEALFISAKTASVHVTHILQKLNVTTRVQAAVAANRLDPVVDQPGEGRQAGK